MWTFISDSYVFDYQTKQYRLHVTVETDIPVSYLAMPRDTFEKNQLIPYFKDNNMIFLKKFREQVDLRIKSLEQKGFSASKSYIEKELYQRFEYVFYRLEKRYIANEKLCLEFAVYEPKENRHV